VDGLEVADAGRIPSMTLQYGALYKPAVSKILVNTFNGGLSFAMARNAVLTLSALAWIEGVGLMIGLWAAARELGLRLTAPLFPVLIAADRVFLNREITNDLTSYKTEAFGRVIALAALVLAIRALRYRMGRRDAVLAGFMAGVAAGTHLVPIGVVAAMVGWYAVGLLVVNRDLRRLLRQVVPMGLVAGLVGLAILLLPHGDIGFQGATKPSAYQVNQLGFDESEYLYTGRISPPRQKLAGGWYIAPGTVLQDYVERALHTGPTSRLTYRGADVGKVLLVGGFVLALLMLLWRPLGELRPLGLVSWGTAMVLLVLALFFSYHYKVYVPAWFGVRRLFDYSAIPIVLFGLALVEGALLLLRRASARLSLAAGLVIVAVVSALVIPSTLPKLSNARHANVVRLINWIRTETPCDARILANSRTVGVFRVMTGRVAVLEGMGPFLRPDMLHDVVRLVLGAKRFFADPSKGANFLSNLGIDYVVAVPKGTRLGYAGPIGHPERSAFDGVPFLQRVYSSPAFDIYRVTGLQERSGFVSSVGRPGYLCQRTRLAGLA